MSIFRIKTVQQMIDNSKSGGGLKKTLNAFDLIMIGVGAIIGVGIFVATGPIVAQYSGPAITVSFLIAGVICVFTALAYAELSALLPISGGAYSYSYVVLGEIYAWIAGTCVIMIYTFSSSSVAAGWSSYVIGAVNYLGFAVPDMLTKVPAQGGIINLPAVFISLAISMILVKGSKESALVNTMLVIIKLGAILVFVFYAVPHVDKANWDNFMPHGFEGVMIGTGAVFLAYSGFDTVATSAEECKNPNRDLAIGIIGSVLICAVIYILVSGLLTAIVPYNELDTAESMAYALRKNGSNVGYAIVAIGGITGMTTVIMMQAYGQSRVLYSMARDGMIPKFFNRVHPKHATPSNAIYFTCVVIALISGFLPLKTLGNLTSMASISSFVMVASSVIKMRIKFPEMKRPFKCPAVYFVAGISIVASIYLLFELMMQDGLPFAICMFISMLVYGFYGYKNSAMNIIGTKE